MSQYWTPRTRTKRGGLHPPRTSTVRIGEASSAARRYRDRVWDKINASGYVQLAPGVVVVFERQPWTIVEIAERPADLAGDFAIVLVPASDPKSKPIHIQASAHQSWKVLPEHYAICVACGELPPCRHEIAEDEADKAMAKAEVLMEIPAGACMGCGEAITGRQKAQRFPGPNLWRPDLADGSAVFHARQECAGDADRYAAQWRDRGGHNPQPSLFADEVDR
ncbi:hypothetical protein [Streptomyces sp. NPDC059538]|uniref:hypothetical protein n=1 Tax=Streptomyces sp. NPDC059538 TaxID=3346860 RepID=UPI0036AA28CB